MNRPFGAVDVAANLKGAVPKSATQKILLALAEKGSIIQKTYGIRFFFLIPHICVASGLIIYHCRKDDVFRRKSGQPRRYAF